MRERLKRRFWSGDGDPGPMAWALAVISLVLPIVGAGLCVVGGVQALNGDPSGWPLLGVGVACLAVDIVIDFVWAHPGVTESDQPDLNRRGAQLAGRTAVVVEAIAGGRGKVRLGDTLWVAAGPDMAAGGRVKVIGVRDMTLDVEPC